MLAICVFACVIWSAQAADATQHNAHQRAAPPDYSKLIAELTQKIDKAEKETKESFMQLGRQMIMQQLFVEERIRSDGDSGLKQTRVTSGGTRPYYTNTYTSGGVASIHEHSNYDRTVGMGEFIAVLNGVEFRTRHNDYKMMMPSRRAKDYNALEEVPFPPVPPSVAKKPTANEQIAEMREYFAAFHNQSTQHRDWRPYFKPVLCYLEGAWTTDTKTLQEPFQSDRHQLEASSWFDLQEKIRFMSSTGGKNNNENFSFLPTTIVNVTEDGIPIFAQWNYRIACHPIHTHVDLRYLNMIDDLAVRLRSRRNMTQLATSRAARFSINPWPGSYNIEEEHGELYPRGFNFGKLDKIMYEIPGKDNYHGRLTDDAFGEVKHRVDVRGTAALNAARYHRWYKVTQPGSMGTSIRKRGFSDDNMWAAKTSNPRVVESTANDCHYDSQLHKEVCKTYKGRFTYAIPLELIWLTPLSSWNPYNLTMHERKDSHLVTDGGRNGDLTNKLKAFNGVSFNNFYLTPSEFFEGGEVNRDAADTARNSVGVLDQHGQIKRVSPTGIRIFLPEIHGVGKIRQRYPIMPIHEDGSVAWKNLEALQDVTMDMKRYTYMFENRPVLQNFSAHAADTHYVTSTTHMNPPGMHLHDLYVTPEEMKALQKNGTTITVYTTENNGHQHELVLQRHPTNIYVLSIVKCDGQTHCWDRHRNVVYKQKA